MFEGIVIPLTLLVLSVIAATIFIGSCLDDKDDK